MIDPVQAIILGAVEGLTEFLPISSTGHLILTSRVLGLYGEAVKSFEVVLQAGALVAVVGLYHQRVTEMALGLLGRHAAGLRLFLNLTLSFLPSALLGLLFHKAIKAHLFGVWPVVWALAVGGLFMVGIDFWSRRTQGGASIDTLNYRQALMIGCAQCAALWPGTSRSMATIVGGMLCGLSARAAAEYSFLLALPTLGAATFFDALINREVLSQGTTLTAFACGFLTAVVVALLAVKGFVNYLSRHGLQLFGWYRIALAAVILFIATQRG
jgi:undecaprenyl-diphosphatase